jgi:hypothetical protein
MPTIDSRLTTHQYRRLAEGLLKQAIGAPKEQKQDLISDALRYLTRARAQEEHQTSSQTAPSETDAADELQNQERQIRQLIKQALETPTPEEFVKFLDFTTKFRRLSVWNAYMARIQRPGAHVIATEREWQSVGRYVLPDAVPIMILWPFRPIRLVYELEDTGPPYSRDSISDPFAVQGDFQPKVLSNLTSNLKKQRRFKIIVETRRHGSLRAGTVATQGTIWNLQNEEIGKIARQNATSESQTTQNGIPAFRVTVNERLADPERFVTIAHELAHIFCGHLGGCVSRGNKGQDESGWPDRRGLGKHEREIEAEATAFHVASRAGLVTGSAAYLAPHVRGANLTKISVETVVRAAARIERLAKIRYGSMDFG